MKKLYVFLAGCLLSAVFCAPASAQTAPPDIYISEINWAGSAISNADEWIELYNGSSESVDLGAWVLTGAATSGNALAIADGFIAAPQSTVLIANYGLGNEKTTLAIEPNLVTTALSLSNSGLSIMLTMPDGTVVDEVTEQIGASNPFVSMTRLEDGTFAASTSSQNLLDANQLGTPGTHSFAPSGSPISGGETPSDPLPVMEGLGEEVPSVTEEVLPEPAVELEPSAPSPSPIAGGETTEVIEPEPVIEPEAAIDPPPVMEGLGEEVPTVIEETIPEPVVVEPVEVVEPMPIPEPIETPEPLALLAPLAPLEPISYLPGTILINEIVSDPSDGIEFIELYNPGETEIDLTN